MEPMTLGSPSNSPAANTSSMHYLPSFLMEDPNAQHISSRNNTLSPNKILSTPPKLNSTSPTEFNKSVSQKTLFGYHQTAANNNFSSTSHNVSSSGPPTQGLFDTLRSENSEFYTPTRPSAKDNLSFSYKKSSLKSNQFQSPINTSYIMDNSIGGEALLSPTTGYNRNDIQRQSNFWITVFGFPPNAISIILDHFSHCGTILDKVFPSQNGNWVNLKFSSMLECDKAMNSNQKILGNGIMIGVTNCRDMNIINKDSNTTAIRPLSQVSYQHAQMDSAVVSSPHTPQRSSGLVNKAMDMLFGW